MKHTAEPVSHQPMRLTEHQEVSPGRHLLRSNVWAIDLSVLFTIALCAVLCCVGPEPRADLQDLPDIHQGTEQQVGAAGKWISCWIVILLSI